MICGCENGSCEGHAGTYCRAEVNDDGPFMLYIGPVCKPCAVQMGKDLPMAIEPPYGTLNMRPTVALCNLCEQPADVCRCDGQ